MVGSGDAGLGGTVQEAVTVEYIKVAALEWRVRFRVIVLVIVVVVGLGRIVWVTLAVTAGSE